MRPTCGLKKALAALLASITLLNAAPVLAAGTYGEQLEGFSYPFPLQRFSFSSQQLLLSMGYMDVRPTRHANGQTVVVLYGKNFCGVTWEENQASRTAGLLMSKIVNQAKRYRDG